MGILPDTFKKLLDFTPVLILLIMGFCDAVSSILSSFPKSVYKGTFCQHCH